MNLEGANRSKIKTLKAIVNRGGGSGSKMFDLQGARMERKKRDFEEAQLDAKIKAHEDLVEEKDLKAKADAARRHPELTKNPYSFGDGIEKPQVPPMKLGGEPGTYSERIDPFAADFANKEDGEVVAEGTMGSARKKLPELSLKPLQYLKVLERSPSAHCASLLTPLIKSLSPKMVKQ